MNAGDRADASASRRDAPGVLIGRGRSADVYDLGDGRVLRRRRSGPIASAEHVVMNAVREAGFPAPRVYAVDGSDMVMERVDGVDLLTRLTKRPWEARTVGSMLADLQRRLAAISVGETGLTPKFGVPESFVHGDLHPGNVLMTDNGPVVIDWEGAGIGANDADIAITWLLLETGAPDDVPRVVRPLVGRIRSAVLRAFLSGVEPPSPRTLAAVCERRMADANMTPGELDAIRAFSRRHAG